jgi:hypothetical protein
MRPFRSALKSRRQRAGDQKPFAMFMKNPLTVVPTNVAQLTTVIDIKTNMRAYSIAVAPDSSARSAIKTERTRSIITMIPGGMLLLLESKTVFGSSQGRCPNAAGLGNDQGLERSSMWVGSLETSAFFPCVNAFCRLSG